jgi:hypothetical protein
MKSFLHSDFPILTLKGTPTLYSAPTSTSTLNLLSSSIQCDVKASNHPKHDAALKQLLIDVSDPQEVIDHFLKEWKPEAIDGEGKVLSEEWHSPSPSTKR